ncbi:MAG TPA: hypothetical protein VKY25_00535 [Erysipelothrix sp.]|nr:hypothetical protein [Erysipelothrix sp.]
MSKYDAFLTEVVYEIDDVIYDFYQKSNDLIKSKRNQEKLFEYRDKTIETVNDMNVRSLEIIASVKKRDIVEERSALLVQRNELILQSALDVIETSPSRGDLVHEVKVAAAQVLGKASDMFHNVQKSETYNNLKEGTVKGYERLRDKVKEISEDERVQDGLKTAKDKSKEIYHKGGELVSEGVEKFKEWVEEGKEKAEDLKDDAKDTAHDVKEDVETAYHEIKDEAKDVIEDLEDDARDGIEKSKEKAEDVVDDVKDKAKEVKDEAVDAYEHAKDAAEDVYEDVEEKLETAADKGEEVKDDFIEEARKQLEDLENDI